MPRPIKCRRIEFFPDTESFIPSGNDNGPLEEYVLKLEELELDYSSKDSKMWVFTIEASIAQGT